GGQCHPAGRDPGLHRRHAAGGGAAADPVPRGRSDRSAAGRGDPLDRACRRGIVPSVAHFLRPAALRGRQQRHGRRILRRADRAHHRACLHAQRLHRRARRDAAYRLHGAGLSRYGRPVPVHVDRSGSHRRRLDPRRQRPLYRHDRRRLRAHHPHRPPAGAKPLQRRAAHRLRCRYPHHRVAGERGLLRPRRRDSRRLPPSIRSRHSKGRIAMIEVECVVDAKAELGEATYWDPAEGVLWWIDIYGPTIHRYDPATGTDRTWQAPEYLGTISLRKKGGLVVSMRSGFYFFDPKTGKFTPIVDPESEIADSRFNDGKTDRQGRFWSGSMWEAPGKKPEKIGALWRLDADLSVHKVIHHVGCSNGLAWSPDDKTLYFTASHTNFVWAYDFD